MRLTLINEIKLSFYSTDFPRDYDQLATTMLSVKKIIALDEVTSTLLFNEDGGRSLDGNDEATCSVVRRG